MKSQSRNTDATNCKTFPTKVFCLADSFDTTERLLEALQPCHAAFVPFNKSGALSLIEAEKSGASVLVLSEPVEYALARAFHVGGNIEQIFGEWASFIRPLRDVVGAAPERVRILMFASDTNEIEAELARQGLAKAGIKLPKFPPVDPLTLLAAESMIRHEPEILALSKEIASLAQISPKRDYRFELENALGARAANSRNLAETRAELDATLAQLVRMQESKFTQSRIAIELQSEIARSKDESLRPEHQDFAFKSIQTEKEETVLVITPDSLNRISTKTVRRILSAAIKYRLATWKIFSQRRREKFLRSAHKRDPFVAPQAQQWKKKHEISCKRITEVEAELARTLDKLATSKEELDSTRDKLATSKEELHLKSKKLATVEAKHRDIFYRAQTSEENAIRLNREVRRLQAVQAGLEVELGRAEAQVLIVKKLLKLPLEEKG